MNEPSKLDKAGELDLVLGDKTWRARLTFRAVRAIERSIDGGMHLLATKILQKDFRYGEMATVFYNAILGGGAAIRDAPTEDQIGDMLMQKQIHEWIVDYSNLVIGVVSAGQAKRIELEKTKETASPGEANAQTSGVATSP